MKILLLTGMYPTEALPWNGIAVKAQVESLEAKGVSHELFFLEKSGSLSLMKIMRPLYKILRSNQFDVLHIHYGVKTTLLAQFSPVPVVATYHGTDVNGWVWNNTESWVRTAAYNAAARVVRILSGRFQAIIVMSEEMKNRLPHSTRKKTHVIPMGTDAQKFTGMDQTDARQQLRWGAEPIVAFANSNNEVVKRQDIAEAALQKVKERIPDARLFVMHGIDHTMMPVVLSAADCLLVTSDKEGSPNVVREAIMCGLPIVSVDVGDVPQLVERYEGPGRIVARDPVAIADAIIETIRQGKPPVNLQARNDLSLEAIDEKVLAVYAEVLNRLQYHVYQCTEKTTT